MKNLQNSSDQEALNAHREALTVIQQAVSYLAKWAGVELTRPDDSEAIIEAKKYLPWSSDGTFKPLRLLFDSVKLSKGQSKKHYWKPDFIKDNNPIIPYPQSEEPKARDLEALKEQIKKEIGFLKDSPEDWKNLSLLMLILEKFGSFISFGEENVALVDIAKSTAAVAAILANNLEAKELSLIAGDLSGIQKFIYTISSDGALKSLRARSFYLELVTEEVVQQLLKRLKLPRCNVIYAGGGNLYILAPGKFAIKDREERKSIEKIRLQFNQWLLDKFQGKVFLALDCKSFQIQHIATAEFAQHWSDITKDLAKQKSRKFAENITEFIQECESHEPCRVCHRDDVKNLKPLNPNEVDSVVACDSCCEMFRLGGQLLKLEAIVRSNNKNLADDKTPFISFELGSVDGREEINVYYYLFETWKPIVKNSETVLLINNWNIENYKFRYFNNPVALLLGKYGKETETPGETGFIRANEMADKATGINRVGYLRMDVDRLGRIFAEGLDNQKTLPRIAGLSRQMSYFFKVYLNSLAESRNKNVPRNIKQLTPEDERLNLLFIYAGGDDLFISGAWNEVVEFGFDVYQCFRAFTGNNPDITLSGGISIADAKFPLYQSASESGEAEEAAKANGRDSLGLFGKPLKWSEWLGKKDVKVADLEIFDDKTKEYLGKDIELKLFGVFPLVEKLKAQKIELNYARSFVRNLLDTAQIQEQMIKEIEEKRKKSEYNNHIQDIRYYLHLPKIAYSLARLPAEIQSKPDFEPIRQSLINQYNAPYFRAIATWLELLNRTTNNDKTKETSSN